MIDLILSWWGLIVVVIAGIIYLVKDWQTAKEHIMALIFTAEEQAREKALHTGKAKLNWVVNNGYPYMPFWFRIVISEVAFQSIVQNIFNQLVKWVEQKSLSRTHIK